MRIKASPSAASMVLVTAAISLFLCIVPAEARNPRRASSQIPRSTWAASQGSTARVFTFDGFVTGQAVSSNVNRYTIPYAQPPVGDLRFQAPQPRRSWGSWMNPLDASNLQAACPTLVGPVTSTNEDCLYLNIYAPTSANYGLSPMVWLHGGGRSAIDPGLDGSRLAEEQNIIVITVEYRGGAFGFLKNDELGFPGNQGLHDIELALQWIHNNIIFFGGNPWQVTLAGQSTGGSLIRSLLAVPSADSLFSRAILQSAPINYGDHTKERGNALGKLFTDLSNCTDASCLLDAPVEDLLYTEASAANMATNAQADDFIAGVAVGEPFRPFVDGTFLRGNLQNNDWQMTRKNRSFIITSMEDDAAGDIAGISTSFSSDGSSAPIPASVYPFVVTSLLLPETRSQTVLESGLYEPDSSESDSVRETLTVLGTDYIFRCAAQQAAVNVTVNDQARRVFYGAFKEGIQYITNADEPYCDGKACHEDDILLVFGNTLEGQELSQEQLSIQNEVMNRWGAFVRDGRPQAQGYQEWPTVADGTSLNMLALGENALLSDEGSANSLSAIEQTYHPEACGPDGLWSGEVSFDYAIYGP